VKRRRRRIPAGEVEAPPLVPSVEPPKSFTLFLKKEKRIPTTVAPCSAKAKAYALPKPLPPPVTKTTKPSKDMVDQLNFFILMVLEEMDAKQKIK
jgi:hypothetical protein